MSSNSELHAETQSPEPNLEQEFEPETSGMSGIISDEDVDADDDSDRDPHYHPHDCASPGSESDVAEDDAFIWKNLEHQKKIDSCEEVCIFYSLVCKISYFMKCLVN